MLFCSSRACLVIALRTDYPVKALNMVIIEVKWDFDGINCVLGEHRWSEFLRSPSKEEMEEVTQVYYCVYNSGMQVQKNGVFLVL
jgi:hypothetical protein